MDPKQKTEGQSAFEPGQLGSSTLSTGANVSRTMDSLNSATNTSRTSGNVFNNRFHKVEAGTGDIIIPGDTKKPKQPMDSAKLKRIALFAGIGVGVVVLILVIVLVVSSLGGNKKSNANTTNSVDSAARAAAAKTAFDEYLNELIYGDDGAISFEDDTGAEPSISEIIHEARSRSYIDPVLYADMILYGERTSATTAYIDTLDDYLTDFEANYDGEYKDEVEELRAYYIDSARLGNLNELDVIKKFAENDYDSTLNYITSIIMSDSENYTLTRYTEMHLDYLNAFLDVLVEAKTYNCPLNETFYQFCDITILSSYGNYWLTLTSFQANGPNLLERMRNDALDVLLNLYLEQNPDELEEE